MSQPYPVQHPATDDDLPWARELLSGLFQIRHLSDEGHRLLVQGRFLVETEVAYADLAPRCRERGYTLLFRRGSDGPLVILRKGIVQPRPNNRWLPILLAALTALSVLGMGTLQSMQSMTWAGFAAALPEGAAFAATLLAILVCHELGHYFMARRLGVATTPPYLIPFPFNPFGTLGAVISMKDIPPSRRAMLLIGAAGPVAGLVVAVPLLALGLTLSQVEGLPAGGGYVMEGNSVIYGLLKLVVFGEWLPVAGRDVMLHPVAFAGWAGILVTSFNLMPIGQLDGGHAASALLGDLAGVLNWIILAMLVVMGITLWPGWLLWAALGFFVARAKVQPLDDLTPIDQRGQLLAALLIILFLLTFTPVPMVEVPLAGSAPAVLLW